MRKRHRRRGAVVAASAALAVTASGALWVILRDDAPARERCAATVDGTAWYLSPTQAENAALIAGTSVRRGLPARAATIGLATALQESSLVNVDYGDRDSLGLFQQRPSQGWGTPEQVQDAVYATNAFYDVLVTVPGYEDMEITVAAQTVQRSAFPDAYAQHEGRARAWASALTGNSPAAITCELGPVTSPAPSGAAAATFTARAERDLGLNGATVVEEPSAASDTTAIRIDASGLASGNPERAGWAAAQWAVATAAVTDVVEVRVGDRVWSRDDAAARDRENDWRPSGDAPLGDGIVTVRIARTD